MGHIMVSSKNDLIEGGYFYRVDASPPPRSSVSCNSFLLIVAFQFHCSRHKNAAEITQPLTNLLPLNENKNTAVRCKCVLDEQPS